MNRPRHDIEYPVRIRRMVDVVCLPALRLLGLLLTLRLPALPA